MAIIRCPHCGTANREGSNFCNSCGVDLRAPDKPQDGAEPSEPEATEQSPGLTPPPREESQYLTRTPDQSAAEDEPWLKMEFTSEEAAPPFEEEEQSASSDAPRMTPRISGLLAPVRIAVSGEETENLPLPGSEETVDSQVDLWRRVRTRMASPPLLAGFILPRSRPLLPDLQIRWLFLVLAVTITVPAFFAFAWPSGSATLWPGVDEAFQTIDSLPVNSSVLVYWAYDPSTAGELDLEALPITTHLFQQRARMSIVTQLPGGPATARRLVNQARLEWQRNENLTIAAKSSWTIPITYLPGGASILALVGQNPDAAFAGPKLARSQVASDTLPDTIVEPPDLAVVFAAQADDIQHWLEQVQPLNNVPVVAVVAAGADPVVRPYLDSGQLVGLVSGFDGAYNYQQLLDEQARRGSADWLDMQLMLQDWGQFVFFLAIVLGNFAAVLRRGERG